MATKQYNRRDRKRVEKSLGLQKPKTKKEQEEFRARKLEAGKQIHQQFTENVLNEQEKQAAERESKIMSNLMSDTLDKKGNVIKKGMTYEEAKAFVLRNYEIERVRLLKKVKKEENRKKEQEEK